MHHRLLHALPLVLHAIRSPLCINLILIYAFVTVEDGLISPGKTIITFANLIGRRSPHVESAMDFVASPTSNEARQQSQLEQAIDNKLGLYRSHDITIAEPAEEEPAELQKPPLLKHVYG